MPDIDAETLALTLAALRERYPDDADYDAAFERLEKLLQSGGDA
jgi:hypothetical protein